MEFDFPLQILSPESVTLQELWSIIGILFVKAAASRALFPISYSLENNKLTLLASEGLSRLC